MATSMNLFDFYPHNTNHLMVIVDEDDDDIGCPSSPSSAESSPASSPHIGHAGFSSYNNLSEEDDEHTSPKTADTTASSQLYVVSELDDDKDHPAPARKGLSRHFSGKSQSFTSLANARCLQDLVKPARKMPPCSKTMRSCSSCAAGLDGANTNGPHSPKGSIVKRPIRNTSSNGLFHHHHNGSRPPMHPHSSGNLMLYA